MTIPGQHVEPLRRLLKFCRAMVGDYAKAGVHEAAAEWEARADALAVKLDAAPPNATVKGSG